MIEKRLIPDQEKINAATAFLSGFSSVILGTVKNDAKAHTSYAPFISKHGYFYVYVSGLAEHCQTLKNGSASLFFIEDEQQAKTIFARTRLTIECQSLQIGPDNPDHIHLLDDFEQRHGSTVKLLRSLPDFVLFRLQPLSASFVTGFGAAYDVSPTFQALTEI